MTTKKFALGSLPALLLALTLATSVSAATTVVVSPTNEEGWTTADTRPGGDVNFIEDATSPFPNGALQLTTNDTNEAKAQYMHEASTPLDEVTDLSYYTKQVAGPVHAAPSYQLAVDLNGTSTAGGFTTLVYEPYWNGVVASNTWQQWNVDEGNFWSSQTFTDGTCSVAAGAGGAPFYTLAALQTACPDATVLGFGVSVGTYNPGYDVYTDGVVFNDTTYDFELVTPDTVAPALPTHLSPADGSTLTTAELTKVDWTDVTDDSEPVTYYYQSSLSSTTNLDGSFTAPAYTSGPLTESEIATPGTPEGTYYWHVRAVDAEGNSSDWTDAWSFTIDNTIVEPEPEGPMTKDDCKNGGWMTFTNPAFKNQGQCVSSVATTQNDTE